MKGYTTKQWTLEEFKANRDAWTELLLSSNADPLFSSWEWQYAWWTEGDTDYKELQLIAIYYLDELVALAPLFTYQRRLNRVISITRCQFIGCSYELVDLCRSDNIDIIIKKNIDIEATYKQLLIAINKLSWKDFIIDGASKSSHIWQLTKRNQSKTIIHMHKKIYNYIVMLNESFQRYSDKLKKKVRQKTILHRRFIENNKPMNYGDFSNDIFTPISHNDHADFFSELNRLKIIRWDKPVYRDNRLKFQKAFLSYCKNNKSLKATSSTIIAENKTQSAFYSISAKKQNYFLQFAFNPDFNQRISLGYIHLGYVIEKAYEANMIQIQLLPGGGKKDNYKHHFANKIQPQLTYRLIKNNPLCRGLFFLIKLKKLSLIKIY